MKIQSLKIVYFSPTGTTKKIVEAIAQGINYSTTEIVDITRPEGRKQQLQTSENELLVIGVPVYFGRVQANAIEWLNTIEARNTPAVCVVVYGNREYDDALLELKDTAVKVGGLPIACAAFIGEHSFSSSEAPLAAGRPDADDLSHAKSFGRKIRKKILSIPSINHIAEIAVPGKYPYIDMVDIKKMLSCIDFIAVNDSCLQCGVCAQHCPVGAIDFESSVSIDRRKCILCTACIKVCPENARKINNDMIKKAALRLSQTFQARKEPIFFL
jgi:ferredoxin/flavodoxin